MATLTLDNLPNELYQALHTLAAQQNQSLSEAAVGLLTSALTQRQCLPSHEITDLLEDLRRDRERLTPPTRWLDSTALVREDRDR